jgi:hypothetical protein
VGALLGPQAYLLLYFRASTNRTHSPLVTLVASVALGYLLTRLTCWPVDLLMVDEVDLLTW